MIIRLNKKYQKIFVLSQPFYKKAREMEEEHHLVVAEMMLHILKEIPLDEEVMMAAALLHDIGYAKIPPKIRKTHWLKQVKKDHMKFGTELARGILEKVEYPTEKIEKVCEIIAVHDNPEVGLPIISKEGQLLKEADILWMTTEKAFWLDVKRRGLTPENWLKILEKRFTKEKAYTQYLKTKFSKKRTRDFIKKMKRKIKLH